MYLHLGRDTVVPKQSVVGIFDLDNTSVSKRTRETLEMAEREGNVVPVSNDLPRSLIVCEEKETVTFYLSQISPATLSHRWEEEKLQIADSE